MGDRETKLFGRLISMVERIRKLLKKWCRTKTTDVSPHLVSLVDPVHFAFAFAVFDGFAFVVCFFTLG